MIWTERHYAQTRENLKAILFPWHGFPELRVMGDLKDRTLFISSRAILADFWRAVESSAEFRPWNLVGNHGVSARRGFREHRGELSLQIIEHGDPELGFWWVEVDIDPANPGHGFWFAIRHAVDVVGSKFSGGKPDPFKVRELIIKRRHIPVPLVTEKGVVQQ